MEKYLGFGGNLGQVAQGTADAEHLIDVPFVFVPQFRSRRFVEETGILVQLGHDQVLIKTFVSGIEVEHVL